MTAHESNGTSHHGAQSNKTPLWSGEIPTTTELLEAAVLDALGVLDEADADAYARALAAASPEVRAAVLDEQARLAVAEELLADTDAPEHLRDRVIAAVHDAIAARGAPAEAPTAVRHSSGRALPKMARPRRVHAAWRAATIGLAVAVVSLAVVQVQLQGDYRAFRNEAGIARLIEAVGVAHIRDMLVDPGTEQFVFAKDTTNPGAAATTEAAMWSNPRWDVAQLYLYRLPQLSGATFRVVELDDTGKIAQTLQTFQSRGLLDTVSVPALRRGESMRIAVVMDTPEGTSERLLVTTVRLA